jgi:hypothetical protein
VRAHRNAVAFYRHMASRLSRYLRTDPTELEKRGVLDAHLGIDNRLFVDPQLLSKLTIAEFKDSRRDLDKYLSDVIRLLSLSRQRGDVAWREARQRMTFREEHGAALGYSNAGGYGRGIGRHLAAALVDRGKEIVDLGVKDPEIFELIGLFQEKFSPDLLSDMAVGILRKRFLAYTQRVAAELKLGGLLKFRIDGEDWTLPMSPDAKRGLVFVPSNALSDLPVALDPSEIGEVAAFNAEVRRAWNAIVAVASKEKRQVTKREIRELFFSSPKNLADLVVVYRNAAAEGYDFADDPEGLFSWDFIGRAAAAANPLTIQTKQPRSMDELWTVLRSIVRQFKKNIEENKLYEMLYREDGRPRHEVFAQRLFFAVADAYCDANNVDLSREVNAGNGPVDFKLSIGYKGRILVEVKKSSNSSLLHGFETQLPAYARSEDTEDSLYLIMRVSGSEAAIRDVLELRDKQAAAGKKVPEIVVIDARTRPPASKR